MHIFAYIYNVCIYVCIFAEYKECCRGVALEIRRTQDPEYLKAQEVTSKQPPQVLALGRSSHLPSSRLKMAQQHQIT